MLNCQIAFKTDPPPERIYYLDIEELPNISHLENSIKKLEAKKSGDVETLEKSWQAKFDAREKDLLEQLDSE